ncbi:UNVERIFIED_CONTAM: hypothetical protein HDU68_000024 [Siphonaria sp. JEL0065]|nr:hypothetical protein HDU68_000024 [Siphonaria sp. JEL0065]
MKRTNNDNNSSLPKRVNVESSSSSSTLVGLPIPRNPAFTRVSTAVIDLTASSSPVPIPRAPQSRANIDSEADDDDDVVLVGRSSSSTAQAAFPSIAPFHDARYGNNDHDDDEDDDDDYLVHRHGDYDDFHQEFPREDSFEIDYAEEEEDDGDEDRLFPDEVLNSSSDFERDDPEESDGGVFMGARRIPRRVICDDDVQFTGMRRRNNAASAVASSSPTVGSEDADAELARRLQEEEYIAAAVQSNNMDQNIEQQYGILHPDSEDEISPEQLHRGRSDMAQNGLADYRALQWIRELERMEAAELSQQHRRTNLYGAGVAHNPANYVSDANFDTSYESLISLGDRIGTAKPKGVNKSVLDSLPTRKFKSKSGGSSSDRSVGSSSKLVDQDDARCAICLTDFDEGEEISGIPCLHWFHGECIKRWLTTSKVCPM